MTPSVSVEDRLNALEALAKELVTLRPMLLKLDKVILQNPGFCPQDIPVVAEEGEN